MKKPEHLLFKQTAEKAHEARASRLAREFEAYLTSTQQTAAADRQRLFESWMIGKIAALELMCLAVGAKADACEDKLQATLPGNHYPQN